LPLPTRPAPLPTPNGPRQDSLVDGAGYETDIKEGALAAKPKKAAKKK
jgi:hypothetical protein